MANGDDLNDLDGVDEPAVTDAERRAWPRTVAEAVDRLLERLGAEDMAAIREMDAGEMPLRLHLTLGLSIRNAYGLWRGNDALLSAAAGVPLDDAYLVHPDEASAVILASLWRRVREMG